VNHSGARVWAALLIASLGWGTAAIATRASFDQGMTPLAVAGSRTTIGFVAVAAYLLIARRPFPPAAAWRLGLVLGALNMAVPFALFTLAVQYVSAGFVGLLIATVPLGTAVFAHVMLPDEQLHRGKVVGLTVSLAGVAVLMISGDSGLGDEGNPLLGIGLTLMAVFVASYAGVFARRHAPHFSAMDLAGTQFAVAAIVLVTVALVFEGFPREATITGWGLMAYLGVVSTFIPFVLFFWMLQRVSATQVSLAGYIVPVIALLGGVILLDEVITIAIGAGGLLVLTGVIITERAEWRHRGAAAGVR